MIAMSKSPGIVIKDWTASPPPGTFPALAIEVVSGLFRTNRVLGNALHERLTPWRTGVRRAEAFTRRSVGLRSSTVAPAISSSVARS